MKTKTQLLENLIREGHISLDEALVLLETEKEVVYVPQWQHPYYPRPWDWLNPPYSPTVYTDTCSKNIETFMNDLTTNGKAVCPTN